MNYDEDWEKEVLKVVSSVLGVEDVSTVITGVS